MNEGMKAGLRLTFPPSESSLLSFLLQVALETLSLSGPQKPPTHLLADYHYAGTGARLREWVCPASTWALLVPLGVLLGPSFSCLSRRAFPLQGTSGGASLSWLGPPFPLPVVPSGAVPSQERDPLARERCRRAQMQWLSTPAWESGNWGSLPPVGKSLNQWEPCYCICKVGIVLVPTC